LRLHWYPDAYVFVSPLSLFNIRALRFCAVHVHKCTLRTKSSGNPILNGSSISSLTASDGRRSATSTLDGNRIKKGKTRKQEKKETVTKYVFAHQRDALQLLISCTVFLYPTIRHLAHLFLCSSVVLFERHISSSSKH
jgi:hypothetical protein